MPIFFICQMGTLLVLKATVSSEFETQERMSESAGAALEKKGDRQNEKYLRSFQVKLSEKSPVLHYWLQLF